MKNFLRLDGLSILSVPYIVHRPQGLSCGFPARTEPCFRAVRKRILTGRFPVPYHSLQSQKERYGGI